MNPTTDPTVGAAMNPSTTTPTNFAGCILPDGRALANEDCIPTISPTSDPSPDKGFFPKTAAPWKPSGGGWSPPHGSPEGGWSPPHNNPAAWKNGSRSRKGGSKSAKEKIAKSSWRPMRWIPASGGDWLSYGWDTSWGSDGDSDDFSWAGKWGGNDSVSLGDGFKWDRPMQHGKSSKSKSSKQVSGWDSDVSMSYRSDAWWNAGASKAKSSKKGGRWNNAAMSYGNNDYWSNAGPFKAKSSKKGGSWNDAAMSYSNNDDWSNAGASETESSKKGDRWNDAAMASGNDDDWRTSPTLSTNSLPRGVWIDPAWQVSKGSDFSSSSSSQSKQSSKKSRGSNTSAGQNPSSDSQKGYHAGLSEYLAEAQKKWQNTKHLEKSAGVRVGSSPCPTSRLLFLSSLSIMPILFLFTLC
jgi:hypothetical protein